MVGDKCSMGPVYPAPVYTRQEAGYHIREVLYSPGQIIAL